MKKIGGSLPIGAHPCGKAARALDKAGHTYELIAVGGYKNIPFSSTEGKRDVVVELTGSESVPVLALEDGLVIQGSGAIVEWAKANPPVA